jgi:c(7)-type cytochrome triheme protein
VKNPRRTLRRMGWLSLLVSSVSFAAAFPALVRLPRRDPARSPGLAPALFSHHAHRDFVCLTCHPATFPQAPLAFTHEDMRAGRYCGRCHDGGTGFAIEGARCESCHVPAR